jgi:hypothetical protein
LGNGRDLPSLVSLLLKDDGTFLISLCTVLPPFGGLCGHLVPNRHRLITPPPPGVGKVAVSGR